MAYPDPYPRPAPDPFIRRWLFITACIAALMLLWRFLPAIEAWFTPREAAKRTVTPRGDLAADEQATIELFEKSRASVVYITTSQLVRDVWTRNVFSMPRGTGSGFIWDDAGHVVTNFHVIQGASEATVKLADGRDYQAALVGASPAHDIAVLKDRRRFQAPAGCAGRHQCRPQGGSEGVRYRQPLRPGLDAHHRHRLRARPLVTRRSGRPSPSITWFRPTPPLTPATRAARCSIRQEGSSASTRRSIAPPAPRPGLGSPCRWTPSCA